MERDIFYKTEAVKRKSHMSHVSSIVEAPMKRLIRGIEEVEIAEDTIILGLIAVGILASFLSIGVWALGRLYSTPAATFFIAP
jgi:hypothetical protein